jgi:hypothetical protein
MPFPRVDAPGTSLAGSPLARSPAAGFEKSFDMERGHRAESMKHATAVRVAGWLLVALFGTVCLAAVGHALLSELMAARDAMLPGVARGGLIPGLTPLDLFQLALALLVGMAFRRFLA